MIVLKPVRKNETWNDQASVRVRVCRYMTVRGLVGIRLV